MTIRKLAEGEAAECERILRSLPKWFGIEEAIVYYARAIAEMETWVAETDGRVCGFVTIEERSPVTAEINVMAVRAEFHGKGIGRALVEHAERLLVERGYEFFEVKTLAPSLPNAAYERTRGFYSRMGFKPFEENDLWGEGTPCLIMVKHLPSSGR